jgi:hypothetical protein
MKFSLIYEAQTTDSSRAGDRKVFADMVEQCLLAEELGFDVIWAVEHTALTNYAHMSAPETFLAFIAGRTTRIHVGHGVVCLPPAMNHPVKVAERIAMLDLLSEGRLHFGVGKGGTQQEAGTFGYDLAELKPMIDESMYLIPEIMVADEIEHLAALCPAIVLDDNAEARHIGIRGQRYFMESLAYWYAGGERPDPTRWDDEDQTFTASGGEAVIRTKFASEDIVVDFSDPRLALMNPNHAYGTVDDCIGYVGRLVDAGVDEILFICQMGTVPQWAQMETIRNIGEHVIPYFRARDAAGGTLESVA